MCIRDSLYTDGRMFRTITFQCALESARGDCRTNKARPDNARQATRGLHPDLYCQIYMLKSDECMRVKDLAGISQRDGLSLVAL